MGGGDEGGGVDGGEKWSGVWVSGVFTIWTTKTTRTQTGGREGGKGPSWWDVSKHGGLTSTETIRFIWDGEKGGGGGGRYGGGGSGRLYLSHYTVTTRMTPALRWAAIRAILMLH